MIKKYFILFIAVVGCFVNLLAQNNKEELKEADDLMYSGNFEEALVVFQHLLEEAEDDLSINYKVAVCYLNTNIDKTQAIPFLEKCLKQEEFDNNANYLLGRAYHYAGKYDAAIKKFYEYSEKGGGTASTGLDTQKQIEYCKNAKELIKFPDYVTFENLGAGVNTIFPDYFPFVPTDESFILFNSRRDDGSEFDVDGAFTANIYKSVVKDGVYQKATPLSENINTNRYNEEIVGLSSDGSIMLLNKQTSSGKSQLYITSKNGEKYEKPVLLEEEINSSAHEISATISADGNTIIFASNRKGGQGGTDLYVSKKLPIGGWGPAQNMGSTINTLSDEDFPNLSNDGRTLYFSSKGHTSMGGYDIFKASWNQKTRQYDKVKNIGFPINSTYDDMNFRVPGNGRYGYLASLRKEGKGDMDLYRVVFNEMEPEYTVIRGFIKTDDPTNKAEDAFLSVTDNVTGDIYGDYLPNMKNMSYVIILPPGDYNLFVEATGFSTVSKDFKILDKSSFITEIEENILLKAE